MKQYIKFLKFLWVILIVPSLYGMKVNRTGTRIKRVPNSP